MAPLLARERGTYFMTELQVSLKMFSVAHDGRRTCCRKGFRRGAGTEVATRTGQADGVPQTLQLNVCYKLIRVIWMQLSEEKKIYYLI